MPEVDYAFLADAADARPGHKFSVLGGGISRLGGARFPLRHPHLSLVVGLALTADELGAEHELRFSLLAPDGTTLSSAAARISARAAAGAGASVLTFGLDLWNLRFPTPGEYSFRILVNGTERKRLTLVIEQRTRRAGATPGGPAADPLRRRQPPFPPPTGRA